MVPALRPRSRDDLLARIGPGVTVVEVEQEAHSGGLHLLRELDCVRLVAVVLVLHAGATPVPSA